MKFDLEKNAVNFINESLHCYERAKTKSSIYPFSIVNLVHGLELTLKSLLARNNEMLVFNDIDSLSTNSTVGIKSALNRLVNFKIIELNDEDRRRILSISKFRNSVIHFEFDLNAMQAANSYLRIFEFLHYFYTKYLNKDLHEIIEQDNWETEAEILSKVKKSTFVHYHGIEVHKNHPKDILKAQKFNAIDIDDDINFRIRFGDETTFRIDDEDNCGDCGVKKGFFHADGCDQEQCPKCG